MKLTIFKIHEVKNVVRTQKVSGSSGLISHFVNLQIVIPEAHIQGSGSGEHHVDRGSVINLVCIIDKSPTPPQYVFWYHNNNMINYDTNRGGINVETLPGHPTQSRLTITDTHEADSGNYTCSASNTEPAFIYVYVSEELIRVKELFRYANKKVYKSSFL
ncbi:hypothetical protein FQA39_LY04969 [Lamprigera yunnana]|nr:hypothetical protein FQA39_LY04969 [Lamprigera yunnana]